MIEIPVPPRCLSWSAPVGGLISETFGPTWWGLRFPDGAWRATADGWVYHYPAREMAEAHAANLARFPDQWAQLPVAASFAGEI